jgi:hypothetical protein
MLFIFIDYHFPMKKIKILRFISFVILLFSVNSLFSQDWIWMQGGPAAIAATYGTVGATGINKTPGYRSGYYTYTDNSGNLWLYGGRGINYGAGFGIMGDLWKYNRSNNQWYWMGGDTTLAHTPVYGTLAVASSSNNPGARRNGSSWTDALGNFWLFGGENSSGQMFNDLWKYNVSSGQWTWMGGSSSTNQFGSYGSLSVPATTNNPGARIGASSWIDALGNLWLFGGIGYAQNASGNMNDIWKYTPSTNQWTWVAGSSSISISPTYGTLGVPSSSTNPGSRAFCGNASLGGNLYIFGGAAGGNQLWKYNSGTNEWTWLWSNNTAFQNGVYGSLQGIASSTIYPGSRSLHTSWIDNSNNFWVFGGLGMDATVTATYVQNNQNPLNDLWKFNLNTGQWTWMKGSAISATATTISGIQGVPAPANTPGPRHYMGGWIDATQTMWTFGGEISLTTAELWKFNNCTAAPVSINSPTAVCLGQGATITASGAGSYLWNAGVQSASVVVTPTASTTYNVFTDLMNCSNGTFVTIAVNSLTLNVSSSNSIICSGQNGTLNASGATTYSWSTNQSGSAITIAPLNTSTYMVTGFSNGCSASHTFTQNVQALPVLSVTTSGNIICSGQSATLTASGASAYMWNTVQSGSVITVVPATTSTYAVTGFSGGCQSSTTFTQLVQPLPVVLVAASSNTMCSGQTLTLTASGAAAYSWSTGQSGSSILIAPASTSVYVVTGYSNNCSSSTSFTQVVQVLPVVFASASSNTICSGQTVTLTASGAATYFWNNTQSGSAIGVSPVNDTTYFVTGYLNGCSSTASVNVNVNLSPVITAASSNSSICTGETVTITAAGAMTYSWISTGGVGATLQVSPNTPTTYTVIGTDNGCSNTASVQIGVSDCVGFSNAEKKESRFLIYPNPSHGEFTVAGASVDYLEIINTMGQKVYEQKLLNDLTVIQGVLSPGIYYCRIFKDNLIESRMLIVE